VQVHPNELEKIRLVVDHQDAFCHVGATG
jgi:hypothetical protein